MKTRNPKMGMDAKNEEKNAPELKQWSEKKFPPGPDPDDESRARFNVEIVSDQM